LPKLSPWLIRQIYIEHGATYRKPQIVYRSKAEREGELLHQQQEFSSRITRTLMTEPNTDVIYIDETTFHLWMQPARVWIKRGMKVQMSD
jgi:hypothetical protein